MNATPTQAPGQRPAPIKVITPPFRLSFPHLLTPTSDPKDPGKGAWYELTALFPKNAPGLDVLRDAIAKAKARGLAEALWGRWPDGRPVEPWATPGVVFHLPVRDADKDPKKAVMDGYRGHYFMKAKAQADKKPSIVGVDLQPIIDPSAIYGGCWCRASCIFYPFNKNGGQGIAVSLHNVQKLKDDASFGGRSRAEDDFGAGVPDEYQAQAPAAPAAPQYQAPAPQYQRPAAPAPAPQTEPDF
jgi:hypothetical protein